MQIADTLDLLRSLFGLRNCRKQKRGKNCDDGDDNQEFNQRERRLNSLPPDFHGKFFTPG
jgi:hypothetical protein